MRELNHNQFVEGSNPSVGTMDKKEKRLLEAIFTRQEPTVVSEPIELSNTVEVIITQQKISTNHRFLTEEEYYKHSDERPAKAAEKIFNELLPESCVAFWLELTTQIRNYCIEQDKELGKKHFETMFDKTAGNNFDILNT